ncbi:MAG: Flp pilus assembly complex ATPase component TadA [Opitutales bacterium]|nr:Flp pilus assembly complex ATPase component TadA [Opitutales bacterium]
MSTEIIKLLKERGLWPEGFAPAGPSSGRGTGFGCLCALAESGRVDRSALRAVLAEASAVETVEADELVCEPGTLQRLAADEALRLGWLPLREEAGGLVTAVADPLDQEAMDDFGHVAGIFVEPRLADPLDLLAAIRRAYGLPSLDVGDAAGAAEATVVSAAEEANALERLLAAVPSDGGLASVDDGPVERYARQLIGEAIRRRASDIHLEPLERRFRVRFRVDGRLQEVTSPPKRLQPAIVSRVKLMAGISIAEKRLPQDGRIQTAAGERSFDLRVSSMPSVHGETIVMRVLDREGLRLGLPELGFTARDEAAFSQLIEMPDGIFLVTGPTGSGKSTTLYAALHAINRPDRKIITVEDPVEYQLPGINQVQVRAEVGMTFAAALRAMLRQAPNIIMVGEIRDRETAEIAVNASLTGHMVFSTLHTNDAPSAVSRLTDIGVKPFLVSASLRGVLAQRLVRTVCEECAEPDLPDAAMLRIAGLTPDVVEAARFRRGRGCPRCAGRGYYGRKGIFELFQIDEGARRLIDARASLVDLRRHARAHGMRTMREDGMARAVSGTTTIDEVLAVTVAEASDAFDGTFLKTSEQYNKAMP